MSLPQEKGITTRQSFLIQKMRVFCLSSQVGAGRGVDHGCTSGCNWRCSFGRQRFCICDGEGSHFYLPESNACAKSFSSYPVLHGCFSPTASFFERGKTTSSCSCDWSSPRFSSASIDSWRPRGRPFLSSVRLLYSKSLSLALIYPICVENNVQHADQPKTDGLVRTFSIPSMRTSCENRESNQWS